MWPEASGPPRSVPLPVRIPPNLAAPAVSFALLSTALDYAAVDLATEAAVLADAACDAVPSYLGMTVTGVTTPAPTVLVVPPVPWLAVPRASLQIMFPVDGTPAAGTLLDGSASTDGDAPEVAVTLYAAKPGAFVDLAADLAYTYSRPLTDVAIDEHLSGPTPGRPANGPRDAPDEVTVGELSIINQAIGVLIGRGDASGHVADTLTGHAAAAGITVAAAAAAVLASTAP